MAEYVEYIATAGALMGAAAWLPKMLAILTRKRQIDVQSEISRFEAIMKAEGKRVSDCEDDLRTTEDKLRQEQNERIAEREYFHRQITHLSARIYECEGILERKGWKEERKRRRSIGDNHP